MVAILKKKSILKFKIKNSEIVRDRAKWMKFGDHMDFQWSQQNIFEHFKNLKNIENLKKKFKNLKKTKFAHISAMVRRMKFGDHMYG